MLQTAYFSFFFIFKPDNFVFSFAFDLPHSHDGIYICFTRNRARKEITPVSSFVQNDAVVNTRR